MQIDSHLPQANPFSLVPTFKCQNVRLDQEGQLTSRKRPRLLIIKKNKAKTRTTYCEERGNKMATQAIPPPSPSGNFGTRTSKFSEKPRICGKTGKFEAHSQVACLGGGVPWRIFPKSADFLIILKLLILKETF